MKSTPKRLFDLVIAVLFFYPVGAHAGLIELIETNSGGQLVLSIEGNALRLTDRAGGSGSLRVQSTPGSNATAADDLGFAGQWPALTVLGTPLQDNILLPTTRLDGLLDGTGISTSGNSLVEITVIDSSGFGHIFDIDLVEVIGGSVPEPSTIVFASSSGLFLLNRRIPGRVRIQAG
jgi:hypothetical protein